MNDIEQAFTQRVKISPKYPFLVKSRVVETLVSPRVT